jgi:hypothetical protein
VATRTLPRRQHQGRFAVSYVTGSHQFKTGVTFRHTTIGNIDKLGNDPDMHGTAVDYRFSSGVPNLVTLLDAPWNFQETTKDLALFAQDQWTIDRVYGERRRPLQPRDRRDAAAGARRGKFVPERRFEPLKNIPNYQNISPRVGVAYDVFGNGKTALKASLGRIPTSSGRHQATRRAT